MTPPMVSARRPRFYAIGALLLLTSVLRAGTPSIAGFNDFGFVEQSGPAVAAGSGITLTNGISYDDAYLHFAITGATSSETLGVQTVGSATTTNGVVSIVGTSIYLGQGGSAKQIGSIDATDNGASGAALRLSFSSPLANGNFSLDMASWTINQNMIILGGLNTHGADECGTAGTFTASIVNEGGAHGKVLRLQSTGGNVSNPFGSMFGPDAWSTPFDASAGDSLAVDWKAENGGDDYEVYGFLYNTSTHVYTELFYGRGTTQAWTTTAGTIPATGNYQFRFVSGSYDLSGGQALGASLYIDNVRVFGTDGSDAVATQLARLVTYHNSSNNPASTRTLTFTAVAADGNSASDTATITISLVDDPPSLSATGGNASYTEDAAASTIDAGVSINDPDGGTIAGATVSITGGFLSGEDSLQFTNQGGISGSYASGTGILSLSGSASNATYQTALRTVSYINWSQNPNTTVRTITFALPAFGTSASRNLSVTAVNDAPTDIALSNLSVGQAAGTNASVGTLSSTDPEGGVFTYSLVAGGGSTDNALFNISGSTLRANNSTLLAAGTYSVRIRTTDSSAGTYEKAFTVTVIDDLAPTITSAATASGAYVSVFGGYTITANEPIASYGASGLPPGLGINSGTGVITGTPTAAGSYATTVSATDIAGNTGSRSVTFTIGKALITVTANNAIRAYGEPNPVFGVICSGFLVGDTLTSLTIQPSAYTDTRVDSAPGIYKIIPEGAVAANYSFEYINGKLTVTSAAQTISFAPLGNATIGAPVTLSASASSGLPVAFEIVSGPATLSGSTLSTTGSGEVIVRASQAGNASYSAAPVVERSVTVVKSTQSIAFAPLAAQSFGAASFGLTATASSGLEVIFAVSSGPATVAGTRVTITGAGEVTITASQPGNATYAAASSVQRSFTVAKGPATVALVNLAATYNGSARSVAALTTPAGLNVNITYAGSPTAPTTAGSYIVVAKITENNYAGEATATLVIAKASTSLAWAAPAAITYGTALSTAQLNATANVPGVVTYTPATGTVLHAGSHPLSAGFTPTDAINYTATTAQTSLTVNPAPLTIQADNLTMVRGTPVPAGTLGFSGWVNGDGPTVLLNAVVVTTTATADSPAGKYALVPVGGSSPDYSLTRVNGTLTITDPAAPTITAQPNSTTVPAGGTAIITVGVSGEGWSYQWYRQGVLVPGATSQTLTLTNLTPVVAGIYDCLISSSAGSILTRPIVIGLLPATGSRTAGGVTTRPEWMGIRHYTGNIIDQFLLAGQAGTFTAAPGRVARMSFLDENESIIQVELSGAGAVTVVLDNSSGPMAPALYNQTGILYMKGKATIVLAGTDETTHLSTYSIGPGNNPGAARADVPYAGWADITVLGIVSTSGRLGGIHQGNVSYNTSLGFTGIYAPTVDNATGIPVVVHEIAASDDAIPYLYFESSARVNVRIPGGTLAQPNGDSITVGGLTGIQMVTGLDSSGQAAPAQSIQASLVDDSGTDVTAALVVGP